MIRGAPEAVHAGTTAGDRTCPPDTRRQNFRAHGLVGEDQHPLDLQLDFRVEVRRQVGADAAREGRGTPRTEREEGQPTPAPAPRRTACTAMAARSGKHAAERLYCAAAVAAWRVGQEQRVA